MIQKIFLILIITWNCTTENKELAYSIQNEFSIRNTTRVQFNVKAGCFNAGRVNSFGKSYNPDENDTLIPPYSAVYVKSHTLGFLELDLAKDNKKLDFSMKAIS